MIHLKRIVKSISKYKTLSGLTLLSLIISFTGIIILSLYISFEKSFDKFHEDTSSIYRLETVMYGSNVPAVISDIITNNIPEVEDLSVLSFEGNAVSTPKLEASNINFQSKIIFSGNSFFHIFSFPLKIGDIETVLTQPNTIVLSETLSQKLFGDANPVGENILLHDESFIVSGVMFDFPTNSSFTADCIPSYATLLKNESTRVHDWSEWSFNIFIKLKPGTDGLLVADKIENNPDIAETLATFKSKYPDQAFINLRSLAKIHSSSDSYNYSYTNPVILNVLILLAVILAVMGIVNFVNFSTSQAPLRSKALSILQVLGGKRVSSMNQIIIESIFISLIAFVISLGIYFFVSQPIETYFGIGGLSISGRYQFLLWFLLFAIGFGIFAGLYPSYYITSSPIAQAVKGNSHFRGKGKLLRNTLITLQFIFTIGLISSAFIIEKQLNFWRNFDIGINKEHVVYLNTSEELRNHHQAFANELLKNNDVTNYTYSQFVPGSVGMGWGRKVDGQFIQMKAWPVDNHFIDFFGIKINRGRQFRNGSEADLNTFILNEKAVEQFEWNKPLEKKIHGIGFNGQIIGIADNFNFSSLKEEVEPMLFWLTDTRKDVLILRIKPGNYTQTFAQIKKTAATFDPKNQVEVKFLDDKLNQLYEKEENTARFIEFVALWCMLLALTGILGLIIFISRDRIKEIGIRKVNGAKVIEVITMLNKDFVKWVAIAFVIAVPIAYYSMQKWLENFAYKTTLSWWIFTLAGVLTLGIALLTVSWQSWRAATRNPIEALRYE